MHEKYVQVNNLKVSNKLLKFVDNELLKDTEISPENFWTGFDHHNYQNESMYPAFWHSDQFYDLQKDHYEQNNLINHEEYELHVDMMRKELNGYVDSLPHIFGEFGN